VREHKQRFVALIPLVVLMILLGWQLNQTSGSGSIEYRDSFEAPKVEKIFWSTTWWVIRQSGVDSRLSLDGDSSLRVVVESGYRRLYGKSGQATERCELFSTWLVPRFTLSADDRLF